MSEKASKVRSASWHTTAAAYPTSNMTETYCRLSRTVDTHFSLSLCSYYPTIELFTQNYRNNEALIASDRWYTQVTSPKTPPNASRAIDVLNNRIIWKKKSTHSCSRSIGDAFLGSYGAAPGHSCSASARDGQRPWQDQADRRTTVQPSFSEPLPLQI